MGRVFTAVVCAFFGRPPVPAAIVNRTFVNDLLETGALGAQFRCAAAGDRVAPSETFGVPPHGVRSCAPRRAVDQIRRHAPPANIAQRVREIGGEIDPSLQMRRVVPLSAFYDEARSAFQAIALAVGFVTAAVLLLSAAGVHAMMSVTIAQRTREIGIRSARSRATCCSAS